MTYTNPWTTTYPAGTDPASGSAADLQRIRVDIGERMETLVGPGNWAEDPVPVLADQYPYFLHFSEFQVFTGAATWTVTAGTKYGVSPGTNNTYTLYSPVLLPRGCTVVELAVHGYANTGNGPITATLESVVCSAGSVAAPAVHATAVVAAGASQERHTSGVVAVTINNTAATYQYYYVKLIIAGSGATQCSFQGVELVYTKPNLAVSV